MQRIIIISDTCPLSDKGGDYLQTRGLAEGLEQLDQDYELKWVDTNSIELAKTIFKNALQQEAFNHLCTNLQESLFHYYPRFTNYDETGWQSYNKVNIAMANHILTLYKPKDMIWVLDIGYLIIPTILRTLISGVTIGLFSHLPFPSVETFRMFPWKAEVISGMLGADLIGFHSSDSVKSFTNTVYRLTGKEHQFGKIVYSNRFVQIESFPVGLPDKKPNCFNSEEINVQTNLIKQSFPNGQKSILALEFLDLSPGIPEMILGYGKILRDHPEYQHKIMLILILFPQISNSQQQNFSRKQIEELVSRINSQYSFANWNPIHYCYQDIPLIELRALYKAVDIALISSQREGMSIVAKEFAVSKQDQELGVLIFNNQTNEGFELPGALLMDSNRSHDISKSLLRALKMSKTEQEHRLLTLKSSLNKANEKPWGLRFFEQQKRTKNIQHKINKRLLSQKVRKTIYNDFNRSKTRLLILDYDGTLLPFSPEPNEACPDQELLQILTSLVKVPNLCLLITSGRDKATLTKWLNHLTVDLIAEYGIWISRNGLWTQVQSISSDWKSAVRQILNQTVIRTQGSFIEEKESTLAWHYRKVDPELGMIRAQEIKESLTSLRTNHALHILNGNKVIEIRNTGLNTSRVLDYWLKNREWEFILVAGDDHLDEDTYAQIPDHGYTIKVGYGDTQAKNIIPSVQDLRQLLKGFVDVFIYK